MQQQLERIMQLPHMAAATQHRGYSNDQGVSTRIIIRDLRKVAQDAPCNSRSSHGASLKDAYNYEASNGVGVGSVV